MIVSFVVSRHKINTAGFLDTGISVKMHTHHDVNRTENPKLFGQKYIPYEGHLILEIP